MPPKQTSGGASRGGRKRGGSTTAAASNKGAPKSNSSSRARTQGLTSPRVVIPGDEDDPFAEDNDSPRQDDGDRGDTEEAEEAEEVEDEDEDEQKTIPPELLTRILHECFTKDGTRISKKANRAVTKYMDIFVRESIARTAVEKERGFLEVEDLEKVAPQLLMDL